MKYRVGAFLRVREDEKDCVRREERRDTHLVSSLCLYGTRDDEMGAKVEIAVRIFLAGLYIAEK